MKAGDRVRFVPRHADHDHMARAGTVKGEGENPNRTLVHYDGDECCAATLTEYLTKED